MDLDKVKHFLRKGLHVRTIMHTDRQVLAGWQESTLTSYNAATKKFAKFKESRNENSYTLPISTEDIYDFVAWVGRGSKDNCNKGKITSKMLAKYLFAIKSWHTFHDAPYPYQTETRVKLMLKASGKQDALQPPRREKSPVLVEDLAKLTKTLSGQSAELNAVADLAIVAFWGMARMSELTYQSDRGLIRPKTKLTASDVKCVDGVLVLELHDAKTAKLGETQFI
jgi:hypothetical protein